MSNSSIWPIDRTLSGATTPSQSWPVSDGNGGVLCIHQSSSITEASPSYCLVPYPGLVAVVLPLLQRCSRCILHPQPTRLRWFSVIPGYSLKGSLTNLLRSSCCILQLQVTGLGKIWGRAGYKMKYNSTASYYIKKQWVSEVENSLE